MDAMTALIVAAALLIWPAATASKRLTALKSPPTRVFRLPRPSTALVAVVGGLAGWALLGPGGAIACAVGAAVGWRYWQARQRLRQRVTAVEELVETLRSLVSELKAGAHPVTAAESCLLYTSEMGIRDSQQAVHEPLFADVAHAWALAQRHGLPLADVLAAVVRDLDQRVRFAKQTHARMAGPRTSAVVLACLPLAGIGLGQLVGAQPLRMLSGTIAGQLLLVAGVVLICAGVLWSGRLTRQVVLP